MKTPASFLKTFFLTELLIGLGVTLRQFAFRPNITVQYPEEKTPQSPRYRYDQIMRLGWKVFIPVTLVWITVEGVLKLYEVGPWAPH